MNLAAVLFLWEELTFVQRNHCHIDSHSPPNVYTHTQALQFHEETIQWRDDNQMLEQVPHMEPASQKHSQGPIRPNSVLFKPLGTGWVRQGIRSHTESGTRAA